MNIDSDWFTKSMLINTLSRNSKLSSQEAAGSEVSTLFSTVLYQYLMQDDSSPASAGQTTDALPAWLAGEISGGASGQNDNFLSDIPVYTAQEKNTAENGKDSTLSASAPDSFVKQDGFDTLFSVAGDLSYKFTSPEKLNHWLEGKLEGTGEYFVRAGQRFNVNPALLAAIAQHETGNGKSRAAIEKNNIAGMMGSTGLKSYSTVEESIMDMARNINKNYLGRGLSTISKIGAKYAPVGAANDPNGLNNYWVAGVTKNFERLTV